MMDQAKLYLSQHGTLSIVFLQYKLRIGYKEAKEIMQKLGLM